MTIEEIRHIHSPTMGTYNLITSRFMRTNQQLTVKPVVLVVICSTYARRADPARHQYNRRGLVDGKKGLLNAAQGGSQWTRRRGVVARGGQSATRRGGRDGGDRLDDEGEAGEAWSRASGSLTAWIWLRLVVVVVVVWDLGMNWGRSSARYI